MSFRIWKYILPFRRIHEWWSNKSPAEKWESIIGIAKTFGNLVGVRVFSDLRLYWYSASPGVCIGIFYLLNLYTIQYYLRHGSFVRGMECTYLIGAVVGNMFMYWETVGPHRFMYRAITTFCGTYFYTTDVDSMRYKQLRIKHIKKLLKIVIAVMISMLMAYAIVATVPIYVSYHQHIFVTPLATNLPFFVKDSPTEYVVNMIIQLILSFYSMCGSFVIVIASSTIIQAIMLVPDLMRFNLLEFQDEWQANGLTSKSLAQLRNTFVQLQDYQRYLKNVIDVFGNKLFICPFLWAFSMSLSIFAALVLERIAGLGNCITCYVEMMIVCYMGTTAKNTNEQIALEYFDMPWYEMPVPLQKQVLCAIHHAQNGHVLTMGPLGDLDFEMAAAFTRQIYKYTMALITVFK